MVKADPVLEKVKEIVFSLPDTKLTMTWGKPHFRVGEKIFCGYGEEGGRAVIGFKLAMQHAAKLTREPGYWPAPYVGHKGWVSMDATKVKDWKLVRSYLEESYRLIASKKSLAKLAAPPPTAKKATTKATTKKATAKKATAKKRVSRKKAAG
ncbi:MAG TPA: MmcQ/YjbR family DNA-binding protein [Polyangiaceae bacterium]|nr:MmcQ/YjbR family DNA-binding protein [Polyangiaceae bacterium]